MYSIQIKVLQFLRSDRRNAYTCCRGSKKGRLPFHAESSVFPTAVLTWKSDGTRVNFPVSLGIRVYYKTSKASPPKKQKGYSYIYVQGTVMSYKKKEGYHFGVFFLSSNPCLPTFPFYINLIFFPTHIIPNKMGSNVPVGFYVLDIEKSTKRQPSLNRDVIIHALMKRSDTIKGYFIIRFIICLFPQGVYNLPFSL